MTERTKHNLDAPFQKISDACRITGLSQYFLRNGCKAGSVPHIKSGPTYYINVPKLLEQLNGAGEKCTDQAR